MTTGPREFRAGAKPKRPSAIPESSSDRPSDAIGIAAVFETTTHARADGDVSQLWVSPDLYLKSAHQSRPTEAGTKYLFILHGFRSISGKDCVPYCRCGNEFSEARAKLGFDCCLECGASEASAEVARRAHMIAPISHKSGYTFLGTDRASQRQRLLEGSSKTPRMETNVQPIGRAARPPQTKRKRYEFVGWEFKPNKLGVRQKRAILRQLPD